MGENSAIAGPRTHWRKTMTTFQNLVFKPKNEGTIPDNVQARVDFDNGYGACVVRGPYTYGGPEGLYELAVFENGSLCYSTPITEDVEGHLSEDDVTALLAQIEALPLASIKQNTSENGDRSGG